MKKILFIIAVLFTLASCGGVDSPYLDDEGGDLTKVGSPNSDIPLPKPSLKAQVEKYFTDFPYLTGSVATGEGPFVEDIHRISVNVKERIMFVSSFADPIQDEVLFEIKDDGSLLSLEGESLVISGTYNPDALEYVLDVNLKISEGMETKMFATKDSGDLFDEAFGSGLNGCFMMEDQIFYPEGDVYGSGRFFISGFVQTRGFGGEECGLVVEDYCPEEGKVSANMVPLKNEDGVYGYIIEKVLCDCRNGKCVGDGPVEIVESHPCVAANNNFAVCKFDEEMREITDEPMPSAPIKLPASAARKVTVN